MHSKVYAEALTAEIREWEAKMDVLKAKAGKASAYSRIKIEQMIDKLAHQGRTAKERVARLKEAGPDNWESSRDRAREAVRGMKESINQALKE